jgi:L-fuculose-phosphate aldolase
VSAAALRRQVLETALRMNALGINHGTSGNVSARCDEGFLITPSGLSYDKIQPGDIVFVRADGSHDGAMVPSSEWRFHRDIFARRPEVNGIVHTHSSCATALACLQRCIPPFHYMVAMAGGKDIRCAPYATFGTQQLSDHALQALAGRKACLLANHGMIATGASLEGALALALEVENLARVYLQALQVGEPQLLSDREMDLVLEKFSTYGQPSAS